jgi:hypothetical protein
MTVAEIDNELLIIPAEPNDFGVLEVAVNQLANTSRPLKKYRLRKLNRELIEGCMEFHSSSTRQPSYVLFGEAAKLAIEAVSHFIERDFGDDPFFDVERRCAERGRLLIQSAGLEHIAESERQSLIS